MGKLVMRAAHVAPIRARCFNSKRTSFHVALELEHVESVDLRSEVRKADAVLPVFARAGQRSDTLKRVARHGGCRLLFRLGVQHIHDFMYCVVCGVNICAFLCHMETACGLARGDGSVKLTHTQFTERQTPTHVCVRHNTRDARHKEAHTCTHTEFYRSAKSAEGERGKALKHAA